MTTYVTTERKLRSQRRFDRLWVKLDGPVDQALSQAKDAVLNDLPDRIVEIGPGHGSNFSRYPKGTTVIAFEPNSYMHETLREAARDNGLQLDLRAGSADSLDLEDESVSAVVSSLVLCSVEDRAETLAEVKRVLAPGGRFFFIEHIGDRHGTWRRVFQVALRRPWRRVADHCDLLADTDRSLERAGFSRLSFQTEVLGSRLDPSALTAYGVAVK